MRVYIFVQLSLVVIIINQSIVKKDNGKSKLIAIKLTNRKEKEVLGNLFSLFVCFFSNFVCTCKICDTQ